MRSSDRNIQYDVAQICPNGHVANDTTQQFPQFNKEYCENCGEKTIASCPQSRGPIRGALNGIHGAYRPPAHCSKCGTAFPWTERNTQAAIELFLDATGATGDDAEQFKANVQAITRDTPQAQVASGRIVKALKKVGVETAEAIRKILVDVASAAVKKTLLGP
jgi:hypothetical protein